MSAPSVSMPAEIAELLTLTFVEYYAWLGTVDVNGQPAYAAPVTVTCWIEGEGYVNAGQTTARAGGNATISQVTRRPEIELYFDGDNAYARNFQYADMFGLTGIPGASQELLQPTLINTWWGPPFNSLYPWSVSIAF